MSLDLYNNELRTSDLESVETPLLYDALDILQTLLSEYGNEAVEGWVAETEKVVELLQEELSRRAKRRRSGFYAVGNNTMH